MLAIIYTRRSTNKMQKYSLEAQKQSCKDFAKLNGLMVLQTYEETFSGKTTDREQLKLAINHAEMIGASLITASISRLGRDVAQISSLISRSKIKFLFADLGLEADSTMVLMYLVFAQHEREMISKRTSLGLKAAKAKGVKLGNPDMDKMRSKSITKSKERGLLNKTRVMPMINMIQSQGTTSLRGIATKLNELHFPTSNGGKWYATTISNILKR